jgi:hypothetical protein
VTARLSRRALLRGAGAAIALPLLDAMTPRDVRAQGRASAPTRLLGFYFPHGVWPEAWAPAGEGDPWVAPQSLAPLAPHRADITVLSGLSNEAANELQPAGGPHSIALGTLLTGHPLERPGTVHGPSWDRVAAASLGASTRFRSLVAVAEDAPGVHEGASSSLIANVSWDGPHRPVPPARSPRALFDRLFGGGVDDPATRRRRSVLDHTRDSLTRLARPLDGADRARIDEHLTAIRELERELFADRGACAAPALESDPATPAARARQLAQLLLAALRCDLTRVASLALGNGLSEHVLTEAGVTLSHHEQSHRPDAALFARITAYQMAQLAFLVAALADVREGEGRLLDRVVLFATSEVSAGWSHSTRELPCLLIGRGGGLRGGGHRRFEGADVSRALLTAMRAAGAEVSRFGVHGTAVLPGLLSDG